MHSVVWLPGSIPDTFPIYEGFMSASEPLVPDLRRRRRMFIQEQCEYMQNRLYMMTKFEQAVS